LDGNSGCEEPEYQTSFRGWFKAVRIQQDTDVSNRIRRAVKSVPTIAAAYIFHIAQNHPFVYGNKRAAVTAALSFLHVNGIEQLPAPHELEIRALKVAVGELGKDALRQWLWPQIGE
jgi:death-on-curing family protein